MLAVTAVEDSRVEYVKKIRKKKKRSDFCMVLFLTFCRFVSLYLRGITAPIK